MATLVELKDRVLRMLSTINRSDDEFDESKAIELIVDGISSAHDAILPWVPKLAVAEIAAGSSDFTMPDGVYKIEAIMDEALGEVIPKLQLEPGLINKESYWIEYPRGTITFSDEMPNALTFYYLTYWTKPESDDDLTGDMEPPESCMTAMAYYACAYVLLPESVEAGSIRQWGIKADSGNPEHNPLEKSVKFLLALFQQEMDAHPAHQKARQ